MTIFLLNDNSHDEITLTFNCRKINNIEITMKRLHIPPHFQNCLDINVEISLRKNLVFGIKCQSFSFGYQMAKKVVEVS